MHNQAYTRASQDLLQVKAIVSKLQTLSTNVKFIIGFCPKYKHFWARSFEQMNANAENKLLADILNQYFE